jgi:hypothetical protein
LAVARNRPAPRYAPTKGRASAPRQPLRLLGPGLSPPPPTRTRATIPARTRGGPDSEEPLVALEFTAGDAPGPRLAP